MNLLYVLLLLILLSHSVDGFHLSCKKWRYSQLYSAANDGDTITLEREAPVQTNQLKVIEISNESLEMYQDLVVDSCIFAINTFFDGKSTSASSSDIISSTLQWIRKGSKGMYVRNLIGGFRRVNYIIHSLTTTHSHSYFTLKECLNRLASPTSRLIVLADDDESRIFAIVELFYSQYWPSNTNESPILIFKIANLIVDKSVRRRGLAKYLISKCIEVARDTYQSPYVYLQVESDNHAAIQLYDQLGFQVPTHSPTHLPTHSPTHSPTRRFVMSRRKECLLIKVYHLLTYSLTHLLTLLRYKIST
jgi:GNAT superfamily N-acetyltransferase